MNINKLVDEKKIIEACKKFPTMKQACESLNLPFNTFKRYAKKLGVYKTNMGGKGLPGKERSKLTIEGLNNDEFSNYQSYKIKKWLIKHHLKENKCECCGISEWNGKLIECALHHKDGNKHNNKLDNLIILCPNCHSQTDNFTAKNKGKYK